VTQRARALAFFCGYKAAAPFCLSQKTLNIKIVNDLNRRFAKKKRKKKSDDDDDETVRDGV
jgi:hypothetical protein